MTLIDSKEESEEKNMNRAVKSRNPSGRFLTQPQCSERLNLSRNTLMRLAYESNSVIRIGKCVRIDIERLEKHILKNYAAE